MSDEGAGAGQAGAAPPAGQRPTAAAAVRLAHVAPGQFVLAAQPHAVPALAQVRISTNIHLLVIQSRRIIN